MKLLITGTSKGIGKCLAEHFLGLSHKVIGISRSNTISEKNYQHYDFDLKKASEIGKLAQQISSKNPDVNILIINAGYGDFKELEQYSEQQIIEQFNVNLLSHIFLIKSFISNLKKCNNAKIIFIGSEAALAGAKKATIYSATKFALRGFAESLRAESRSSNLAVTIINPGMVDTSFYDELNFTVGDAEENKISVFDIKNVVQLICESKNNMVLDEVNLSPMKKVIKFKK